MFQAHVIEYTCNVTDFQMFYEKRRSAIQLYVLQHLRDKIK